MKTEKKAFIVILLILTIFPLQLILFQKSWTASQLSDRYFLTALFFIIIGAAIWVAASGSFDLFQKSMHHARRRVQKELPAEITPLSQIANKKYQFWFEVGISLLLIALFLLLF